MFRRLDKDIRHVFLITIDCLREDYSLPLIRSIRKKVSQPGIIFKKHYTNGPNTATSFPALFTSTPFLLHNGLSLSSFCKTITYFMKVAKFTTVGLNSNPLLLYIEGLFNNFDKILHLYPNIKLSNSIYLLREIKKNFVISLPKNVICNPVIYKKVILPLTLSYQTVVSVGKPIPQRPYVSGKVVTSSAIQEIKNLLEKDVEKIFMWIHYMDTHAPYVASESYTDDICSYREAFLRTLPLIQAIPYPLNLLVNINKVRMLYSRSVQYITDCLTELIDFLEDKGLLENSMILLTSDHGEALNEHGRIGHTYDILYNEVLRVPFIIFHPNIEGVVEYPTEHLGLLPTIVELIGLPYKYAETIYGSNLLNISNNRAIFVIGIQTFPSRKIASESDLRMAVIEGNWKLMFKMFTLRNKLEINDIKLYNLGKDPLERINLTDVEREKSFELLMKGLNYLTSILKRKRLSLKIRSLKMRLR